MGGQNEGSKKQNERNKSQDGANKSQDVGDNEVWGAVIFKEFQDAVEFAMSPRCPGSLNYIRTCRFARAADQHESADWKLDEVSIRQYICRDASGRAKFMGLGKEAREIMITEHQWKRLVHMFVEALFAVEASCLAMVLPVITGPHSILTTKRQMCMEQMGGYVREGVETRVLGLVTLRLQYMADTISSRCLATVCSMVTNPSVPFEHWTDGSSRTDTSLFMDEIRMLYVCMSTADKRTLVNSVKRMISDATDMILSLTETGLLESMDYNAVHIEQTYGRLALLTLVDEVISGRVNMIGGMDAFFARCGVEWIMPDTRLSCAMDVVEGLYGQV